MDREGFRSRMNQYKKAREENPGLKYWEWKDVPKYDEGTGRVIDTIDPKKIVDYNSSTNTNLAKRIKSLESLTPDPKARQLLIDNEKDWAELSVTGNNGPYVVDGGQLPEIVVTPTPIYATLRTEYPFINKHTPWTGHSGLTAEGTLVSAGGSDENYNLFCNNCSNATKNVLERVFNKKYPTTLFTTPGDVLDFAVDSLGAEEIPTKERGVREHRIKLTPEQSKKLRYEAYKERLNFNNRPVLSEKDYYEKIRRYNEGGEVGEELGLWDKFTNTVSVLYNNAARKVRNFFEEETPGEVIDLSNLQVTRVTPDTRNLTAIYGNEFVEANANNIRTRKQFEETTDTLIGDKRIPLSRISNFYGVEDGKLKSGDLSTFNENTVVIPNRAKRTGKIKEIIFPNTDREKLKKLANKHRLNSINRFAEMADSLGLEYGNNWITQQFYGSPYTVIRDEYLRRKKSGVTDAFTKNYEQINKVSEEERDLHNRSRMRFVTESNDTIFAGDVNIPQRFKQFYADEQGNALFVNNANNLTEQQQKQINGALKDNPMYPILIDNGRYMHYQTDYPNYNTYTAYDFTRDPKNMYVVGTLGLAEGGQVQPDPMDVLERSRPKVAGIPINDPPLENVFSPVDIPFATLHKALPAINKWLPNYGRTVYALVTGDNGQPINKTTKPIATKRIEPDVEEFYKDIVIPLRPLEDYIKDIYLHRPETFTYNIYPDAALPNNRVAEYHPFTDEIRVKESMLDSPLLGQTLAHDESHKLEKLRRTKEAQDIIDQALMALKNPISKESNLIQEKGAEITRMGYNVFKHMKDHGLIQTKNPIAKTKAYQDYVLNATNEQLAEMMGDFTAYSRDYKAGKIDYDKIRWALAYAPEIAAGLIIPQHLLSDRKEEKQWT